MSASRAVDLGLLPAFIRLFLFCFLFFCSSLSHTRNLKYGSPVANRRAGQVVKASASGAEDPGFDSRWWRDFSGSSHTSDLKIGTQVATRPGAWRYRVSAGTGRPGVSILWLSEVEGLVLKLLSRCGSTYNCLSRSIPEIHSHVGGTLSKQQSPVPTLPGAWCCKVSARIAWSGVSILWQGEIESLICNFYVSVAAGTIVRPDPFLRYTGMLLGRWSINKQQRLG